MKHYAGVTKYLDKLAITKEVSVLKAKGDQLTVKLMLNGSLEQFQQTLALNRKLVEKKTESVTEEEEGQSLPTVFVWQP